MTGVRNKGAFNASLAKLDDAIQGRAEPAGVSPSSFRLQRLKQINDQYGHSAGDTYLQNACKLICQVYAHSPVFRLGGDEFAVILQGEDFDNRNALLREFDAALEHNADRRSPGRRSTSPGHGRV